MRRIPLADETQLLDHENKSGAAFSLRHRPPNRSSPHTKPARLPELPREETRAALNDLSVCPFEESFVIDVTERGRFVKRQANIKSGHYQKTGRILRRI